MSGPLQVVHVRIADAATGQPTPVRIRFVDEHGCHYAPLGRMADFPTGLNEAVGGHVQLGARRWCYIDGSCEVALPAGRIIVEASKGPEYRPLRHEYVRQPGKMALRLTIERWCELRREGWYSGDTHAFFLSPHAALLEAAGEDLAFVNLLAVETPTWSQQNHCHKVPHNILAFSGQQPVLERAGHAVVVNTYNYHAMLGELALLHCHRPVYPLTFGGPEGDDDWNLADWCGQCHRKRGLVVAPKYLRGGFGEVLADLLLGHVDAVDVSDLPLSAAAQLEPWYALLNAGMRVPLTGGSAKGSNAVLLGQPRTYARLLGDEQPSYSAWIEAVRAGRVFVTTGPLLSFTVDGQDAGAVLELPAPGRSVQIRAAVRSTEPLPPLELLANGRVIAAANGALEHTHTVAEPTWVAVRCGPQVEATGQTVFAHSGAVCLNVEGRGRRADAVLKQALAQQLRETLGWVQTQGQFANDAQRARMVAVYEEALTRLK